MPHALTSWTELITKSWKTYRANFNAFIQPIVLSILISVLQLMYVFFLLPKYAPATLVNFDFTPISMLFMLGWLLLSLFIWLINFGLIMIFLKVSDLILAGKKVDFPVIYQKLIYQLPRFFLISLLYGLIVGTGIILLIIPGIFWSIRYVFAPIHSVLAEPKPYIEQSFRISKEITIGRWWDVAARLALPQVFFNLILIIITYGFAAIIGGGQYDMEQLSGNFYFNLLIVIMNGLFMPLMTMPVVILYRELTAHHNKTE